jgi:hypothetical protein
MFILYWRIRSSAPGASMFNFLRSITFIAAMTLNCGIALAQDYDSANNVMVGCRASVLPPSEIPDEKHFEAGYCLGLISGVNDLLAVMKKACAPRNVTKGQMTRVVVKFIDDQPQLQHGSFTALVIGALMKTFPCKE